MRTDNYRTSIADEMRDENQRIEKRVQAQMRTGKGILKVARELGVGTGTVQRIKEEMTGPFADAAA